MHELEEGKGRRREIGEITRLVFGLPESHGAGRMFEAEASRVDTPHAIETEK
jgi:hypothetical protein